jgi:hypothetical protein
MTITSYSTSSSQGDLSTCYPFPPESPKPKDEYVEYCSIQSKKVEERIALVTSVLQKSLPFELYSLIKDYDDVITPFCKTLESLNASDLSDLLDHGMDDVHHKIIDQFLNTTNVETFLKKDPDSFLKIIEIMLKKGFFCCHSILNPSGFVYSPKIQELYLSLGSTPSKIIEIVGKHLKSRVVNEVGVENWRPNFNWRQHNKFTEDFITLIHCHASLKEFRNDKIMDYYNIDSLRECRGALKEKNKDKIASLFNTYFNRLDGLHLALTSKDVNDLSFLLSVEKYSIDELHNFGFCCFTKVDQLKLLFKLGVDPKHRLIRNRLFLAKRMKESDVIEFLTSLTKQ